MPNKEFVKNNCFIVLVICSTPTIFTEIPAKSSNKSVKGILRPNLMFLTVTQWKFFNNQHLNRKENIDKLVLNFPALGR